MWFGHPYSFMSHGHKSYISIFVILLTVTRVLFQNLSIVCVCLILLLPHLYIFRNMHVPFRPPLPDFNICLQPPVKSIYFEYCNFLKTKKTNSCLNPAGIGSDLVWGLNKTGVKPTVVLKSAFYNLRITCVFPLDSETAQPGAVLLWSVEAESC